MDELASDEPVADEQAADETPPAAEISTPSGSSSTLSAEVSISDAPDPATVFSEFYSSLPSFNPTWSDQTTTPLKKMRLCKISSGPSSSSEPLLVSQSLIVEQDMTWSVFVLGHKVEKQANALLCDIPHHLNHSSFLKLYSILDSATVCPGSPQPHYLDMARSRKGNFLSARKQPMAVLETSPLTTIRTVDCHLLTHGLKCCGIFQNFPSN